MLTFEGDPIAADYLLNEWREGLPHMAPHFKPDYSGFRGQRSSRTSSSIASRWTWSRECLSSDACRIAGRQRRRQALA